MRWPTGLERWRLRIRLALFVGVGGYILLGPVPHQVFGVGHTSWLPRWRMFSGMSLKECAGRFERRDLGAPTPIDDWYDTLGLDRAQRRHRNQARVSTVAQGEKLGERLCKKLGKGADVRLFLRCPSMKVGWVPRARGERNLCEPALKPGGAAAASKAKSAKRKPSRAQARRAAPTNKASRPPLKNKGAPLQVRPRGLSERRSHEGPVR